MPLSLYLNTYRLAIGRASVTATFHCIWLFVLFSTLHSRGSASSPHTKHRTDTAPWSNKAKNVVQLHAGSGTHLQLSPCVYTLTRDWVTPLGRGNVLHVAFSIFPRGVWVQDYGPTFSRTGQGRAGWDDSGKYVHLISGMLGQSRKF